MSKTVEYMITGSYEEIMDFMETPISQKRFLSDKQNLEAFLWYPLTTDVHVVEMALTDKLTRAELEIFTDEYKTLTIAEVIDGEVQVVIAEGNSVVLND